MRVLNQFFAENMERDYPFIPGSAPDIRLFADATFRITAESQLLALAAHYIMLTSMTAVIGGTAVVFTVVGGPLAGATFRGVIPVGPALYQRIRLDFYDPLAVAAPDKGYGFVVMGDAAVPTGAFTAVIEAAATRYIGADSSFEIQLANAICPGDTIQSETPGTPVPLGFNTRQAVTTTRCIEISTNPIDQNAMIPNQEGTSTAPRPIPIPVIPVTAYETLGVISLPLTPLAVNDVLPPSPGYAAVPVGPVGVGSELVAGYNIQLSGSLTAGVVTVGYALGAGAGLHCGPVPGCPPGVPSSVALKSINGVPGEAFEFVKGTATDVIPSPGTHTLYVLIHPEKLTSATA